MKKKVLHDDLYYIIDSIWRPIEGTSATLLPLASSLIIQYVLKKFTYTYIDYKISYLYLLYRFSNGSP